MVDLLENQHFIVGYLYISVMGCKDVYEFLFMIWLFTVFQLNSHLLQLFQFGCEIFVIWVSKTLLQMPQLHMGQKIWRYVVWITALLAHTNRANSRLIGMHAFNMENQFLLLMLLRTIWALKLGLLCYLLLLNNLILHCLKYDRAATEPRPPIECW